MLPNEHFTFAVSGIILNYDNNFYKFGMAFNIYSNGLVKLIY